MKGKRKKKILTNRESKHPTLRANFKGEGRQGRGKNSDVEIGE